MIANAQRLSISSIGAQLIYTLLFRRLTVQQYHMMGIVITVEMERPAISIDVS